jgi:hypothetical protein
MPLELVCATLPSTFRCHTHYTHKLWPTQTFSFTSLIYRNDTWGGPDRVPPNPPRDTTHCIRQCTWHKREKGSHASKPLALSTSLSLLLSDPFLSLDLDRSRYLLPACHGLRLWHLRWWILPTVVLYRSPLPKPKQEAVTRHRPGRCQCWIWPSPSNIRGTLII